MPRDQAAFRTHLETLLPQPLRDHAGLTDALLEMFAAMLARVEASEEQLHNRSFLSRADGPWLDEHGQERLIARTDGETDAAFSERIRTFPQALTVAVIESALQAILRVGRVRLHEYRKDGMFLWPQNADSSNVRSGQIELFPLMPAPTVFWAYSPAGPNPGTSVPFGTAPLHGLLPYVRGSIVIDDGAGQQITDDVSTFDPDEGTVDLIGDLVGAPQLHYATGTMTLLQFVNLTSGPVTMDFDYIDATVNAPIVSFAGQYAYPIEKKIRIFIPEQNPRFHRNGFANLEASGRGGFAEPAGAGSAGLGMFASPEGLVSDAIYGQIHDLVDAIRAFGVDAEFFVGEPSVIVPQTLRDIAP